MISSETFQKGDLVIHSSTKTFRIDRVLKHRSTGKILLVDEKGNAFYSEECVQIVSISVGNFVFQFPRYLFLRNREWVINPRKGWLGYVYEHPYGLKGICVDVLWIYSPNENEDFTASYPDRYPLDRVHFFSDNDQN